MYFLRRGLPLVCLDLASKAGQQILGIHSLVSAGMTSACLLAQILKWFLRIILRSSSLHRKYFIDQAIPIVLCVCDFKRQECVSLLVRAPELAVWSQLIGLIGICNYF